MSEERLRNIVRDGLESLPLPSRFASPSLLITAPKPRRRYTWAIAAAAACLVLGLVASPLGARAVRAVSGWFVADMQVRAWGEDVNPVATPETLAKMEKIDALKPGESLEFPEVNNGDGSRQGAQIYRALTFATLEAQDFAWPLPTYLRPAPDTKVLLMSDPNFPKTATLTIDYDVQVGAREFNVYYLFHQAPSVRSKAEIETAYQKSYSLVADPSKVLRETVQIKGQGATAFSIDQGRSWQINWWSATGNGLITSDAPLAELVKMVDSIPNL